MRRVAIIASASGNGKTALVGRDSLFLYALRSHFRRRRDWPARLARYPVVRLRTPADVEAWLHDA